MLKPVLSIAVAICLVYLPSPCLSFSRTKQFLPQRIKHKRQNTDIRQFSSASTNNSNNDSLALPPRAKLLPNISRYRGLVDEGYGRGGKKLGVPTANLPSSLFKNALEGVTTGVYFGWAALERDCKKSDCDDSEHFPLYKAVVNVGYSPTFEGKENKEKIIEAHLILEKDSKEDDSTDDSNDRKTSSPIEDFYGIPLRIQLIGFLREEKKFDSFPELIAQINADVDDARLSLDCKPYQLCRSDKFLSSLPDAWVGKGGGDACASWESEPIESFLDKL